ncbi:MULTISPECIES: nucleotide sugar dehydrogenase [Actinoalloteichus]|uniref:Nucleotide sugar dehydrogenase n=1 Tax=Actinoalloteichus fjordicus TaxID=1612552 RepID=A0AAC9LDB1_9PSEU|nr:MULTISPECIES: nucleotide sugar dehydrogenase [Actinoalloteichus]APU15522.1 nucleotide sugar dehydrogenase [Actinoalloteichus fjordicus]APU21589.1 nucleotide sugar dehydrogenase [Actinoalloteichus sp. GBA129-24]
MRFIPRFRHPRIAVVGFGYVGSCLGVTLAELGRPVVAIDKDGVLIDELRAGRCPIPEPGLSEAVARLHGSELLTFTTDHDAVRDADIVIITVGTPVDEHGTLLTDALEQVCGQLAARLRREQLVILKSTVSPGTTRTLVAPLLERSGLRVEHDFGLAFTPERLAEGSALAQLRTLPIVVGGCGPDSAAAAEQFWAQALEVPTQTVPTPETAEVVKLATNWWIDANIAIANEVARLSAAFDVDVLDVIGAANQLPKGERHVNILLPSIGVGGSCLVKDPWMVWRAARDRGVDLRTIPVARQVNEAMPGHSRQVISDELLKLNVSPAAAKVAVLGVTFKNDTGDLRNTPVKGVVDALLAAGTTVTLFDPLADPDAVHDMFGIRPESTLEAAVDGAHCVAILAGHRQFREIDFAALCTVVADQCLIFDGRIYYPADTIRRLHDLGLHYRGIGR